MKKNTNKFIKEDKITYLGRSFDVVTIHSDNPEIDGYLTVQNAPIEFGINIGLFNDVDHIISTIEENLSFLLEVSDDYSFSMYN